MTQQRAFDIACRDNVLAHSIDEEIQRNQSLMGLANGVGWQQAYFAGIGVGSCCCDSQTLAHILLMDGFEVWLGRTVSLHAQLETCPQTSYS